MSASIRALAATAAKKPLEPFEFAPAPLGPHDVEIRVSHCGICHSDLHLIDNDWGVSSFPLVPGHEVVGLVTERGAEVDMLEIGARVGVGWQRSACLECEHCVRGDENLCSRQQATCVGNYGGFADRLRVDNRFAFPIPAELSSENAAPLLCGGITVYAPLRHYNVRSHHRVGVVGVGGLGHLALQFARAFGCEVTAFSSSTSKEAEARQFGAHHFISSTNSAAMTKAIGSLDFVLSTVHVDLNWEAILETLRPDGRLCFVGVPSSPIQIPAFALIGARKSVCGSAIGSRSVMREMLDFAARHKIHAKTQVVPMSDANAAIEKVRLNQARYRMVLRNPG